MIENIQNNILQLTIEDDLFLETVLMNIRGVTISYSSWKKKQRNEVKVQLESRIKTLHDRLNSTHDDLVGEELAELNTQQEEIRKYELDGLLLRSKARWIEHGEKPTKYFCNLEKRNYINKTVTKLIDNNGRELKNQADILNEIKHFYDELYTSRDHVLEDVDLHNLLHDYEIPILSNEDRNMLDKDITKSDVLESLKRCKNDKTPGTDGYTSEFFKFFWSDLGDFIHRSYIKSFHKGELSISQKLGIISILPKGNKPREYIKNWRPISLLNVTYKILSGIIANRIKSVLPKLIHENQKGFMSGRYIGENTRLLYDIMHACNENNIPGILLMVDFEKAFDSVSWKFIRNVLNYFNFGDNIQRWINIFFTEFKLCVLQNGVTSPFFKIGRGCRQGDPVSSYIFLLCVEIMGAMFRKNKDIKGINIMDKEYKLLQYADDTAILLDGTEKSLKNSLSLIEQFSKFSGLKPNYSKTSCIKIGSLRRSDLILCNEYNLNWSQEPFIFLGITFSVDLDNIIALNFENKINEIERMIKSWSRRMLSTAGKITVVKSILLPKLTHLFISLPNPSDKQIKDLENLFYKFIWNNKVDKIARKNLIQDFNKGGLRMICVRSFIESLKITWIRRIINVPKNTSWLTLLYDFLPQNFQHFLHFDGIYFKHIAIKTTNIFWKDVFNSFAKLRKIIDKDENILFQPIWYNELFTINDKTVYYRNWFEKGVIYVYDLLDVDGKLLPYHEFCNKFSLYPAFTLYYGIVQCVQRKIDVIDVTYLYSNMPYRPKFIEIITKYPKGVKPFYDILVNDMYIRPKSELKWEEDLNFERDNNWWQKQNHLVKVMTNDINLRWFQYRIVHRILGTNSFLNRIGILESGLCTFCNEQSETILHLFWTCNRVSAIWENAIIWMRNELHIDIEFNCIDIIFGKVPKLYHSYKSISLLNQKVYLHTENE